MRITSEINHETDIFGVCWNPSLRDEYIVGGMNGSVI